MNQRRVVLVVFDGFQSLDLVGPHEVFQHASSLVGEGGYTCEIVARRPGAVGADSGLPVHARHGVDTLDPGGVDTLVVAGGGGVYQASREPELTGWIAAAGAGARRVASVCSGAFLLAAAGLLRGRRVTTHWARAERLAEEYPDLTVDPDPIFIRDGRVWSSAGVTAGMDLALALVAEDLGHQVALDVARHLVLFLRRPGGQSQFSQALWAEQPSTDPIRAVVAAIHADPGARHGIEDLAACAGLSPRHLQRRFTAELGVPPGAYLTRVRLEAAQRALAEGDEPVDVVARRCGLGSAETMRRTFHRHLGITPSQYRDRFHADRK
ncbi:GlxA family transcriptional regulator [Allostreptomyces psammosilenae]|uniref:Transcriptional regulator GlxA family with amidase domain n=1 Tax=Allostreptomyces psammosilenae TaxID=1892865 RepID=A0A852ZZU5_9ACTN|nr:helix-turn-helix domain-containing protein [Allostreptomyces psammosilenae]NYI03792.1 transcriptional regulator GlxA family with amidase domain [Allostreptomyces psammosilenae]